MAHVLKLKEYGESAMDISTGDYYIVSYTPNPTGRDKLVLYVTGSSYSDFQSNVQNIVEYFSKARLRRQLKRGKRVYITFSPEGDSSTYQSELFARNPDDLPGVLAIPETFMRNVLWDEQQVKVTITIQRRPYWELDSESELSLQSYADSGTGGVSVRNPTNKGTNIVSGATNISFNSGAKTITSGSSVFSSISANDVVTVYGSTSNSTTFTVASATSTVLTVHQDVVTESTGPAITMDNCENWVFINGSNVAGDLASPIRVEYDIQSSDNIAKLYYAMVTTNAETMPLMIEGEAAVNTSYVSDSNASSDYKARATWGTSAETELMDWRMRDLFLQSCLGGYFKIVMVFATALTEDVYFRAKVQYASTDLWTGEQYLAESGADYTELGVVQLPPWVIESDNLANIYITLTGEADGGTTVDVDYIQLYPAENFRLIEATAHYAAQGHTIKDDGIFQETYVDNTDGDAGYFTGTGEWPMLQPGQDARLYFLAVNDTGDNIDIDTYADVSVFYRPRRLVV